MQLIQSYLKVVCNKAYNKAYCRVLLSVEVMKIIDF